MNDDTEQRLQQLEHDNAELRDRLAKIEGFHGRIRAGLATMLAKITGKQLQHDQQIAEQDGRIAALETWRVEISKPPAVGSDTAELNQRRLLRGMIDYHFSEEEVKSLAHDVGVDYESLPRNGKPTLIRELVAHCERRGRMGRLVDRCRELRPKVVGWPNYFDEVAWL